jgi:hypothetical protein
VNRRFAFWLPTIFIAVLASGCAAQATPTQLPADVAQKTLASMLTEVAVISQPSETPQASPSPTITATSTEIATVEFIITDTPQPDAPASEDASPTPDTAPQQTQALSGKCYAAFFIGDIGPVQDGMQIRPNIEFTKIWDVRNVGVCTWDRGFRLVFGSGDHMDGPAYIELPSIVPPGGHIFLQVKMISPVKTGWKEGRWFLRTNDGKWFGVGPDANFPLLVVVKVIP